MKEDIALFNELVDLLLDEERTKPVANPVAAEQLFDRMDLSLSKEPASRTEFVSALRDLVIKSPKTSSDRFFNQLFGGRRSESILGDLLTVMLNHSMYTYKVAGPMVGVEKSVLREVSNLIGYPADADGTLASGGSMTNLMAMLMARDAAAPEVRRKGVQQTLIIYTSAESHYSIPKNAAIMGVGRDQIRYIPVDDQGRMISSALEEQIKRDLEGDGLPFFVNATAGTTVLGAFDPVNELVPICKKYNLWLHVDGAYCGAVIFSPKYRHLVQDLSQTDSFSFNAHKMLNTTLTCSILVTRHNKYLYDSFAIEANYLYQTDADDFNLGKTSLQCGRRNDSLKLWTLWKAIGTTGLAEIVENQFHLADVARDYIRNNDNYQLYSFDDSISICFNYKNIPAEKLCTALYEHAELMVGYGRFQDQPFVRLVTINSGNTDAEILNFFSVLEKFCDSQFS